MKRLYSTFTNIAYILAGLALPFEGGMLVLIFLGLASAIHHYGEAQDLDFMAMYSACFAIPLLYFSVHIWVCFILGIIVVFFLGSSRKVLSVLLGMSLIFIAINSGIALMLEVSAWLGLAFGFNHIGDFRSYDILHGIGWHIPTAYALLLAFQSLQ